MSEYNVICDQENIITKELVQELISQCDSYYSILNTDYFNFQDKIVSISDDEMFHFYQKSGEMELLLIKQIIEFMNKLRQHAPNMNTFKLLIKPPSQLGIELTNRPNYTIKTISDDFRSTLIQINI